MGERREFHGKGVGVSEGVVIGRVLRMHTGTGPVYRARIPAAELDQELERFRAAVQVARGQLQTIKERAENELGKEHAYIFDAHLLLLEDKKLISDVEDHIRSEAANAEWVLKVVGDRLLSVYAQIKDDYLRERGSDIEDVIQRLVVVLSGEQPAHRSLSEDAVIVSPELLPSAVAELDLDYARAIATDSGGWTSHMAIIARGLGIPAVVGLKDFYRRARTGDPIIVDSGRNEVILNPSPDTLKRYRSESQDPPIVVTQSDTPRESTPLHTADGIRVRLRANVELPAEFAGVERHGAEGVGLYRSEFLLSRRGVMVSEDAQYNAYAAVAKLAGPTGAIVRLFDLGAEKRYEAQESERNPALGLRAIRYGLSHSEIMRAQVRAILRAAAVGKLSVVLPMVADVADVRRARAVIEAELASLEAADTPHGTVRVGAMIEIPSAVITADKLARAVDFFELGTNDLVQYMLAVDRGNEDVAEWFRSLHPAVIYGIRRSLRIAREAGIDAIVCGEMAATPAYAVLLVGLGAVDLSMTPAAIPKVRRVLSQIDSGKARSIADEALQCETADEVEDLVRERFNSVWPNLFPLSKLPISRSANQIDQP